MHMKDMGNKNAIICVGGGMASSYSAGFLYAMGTTLGIPQPTMVLGTSGAAGNVAYFCAGQYDVGREIWCERICTKQFVSLWRFWKVLDVDYLVDVMFTQQLPLDIERLRASLIQCYIPITNVQSGETQYVDARTADNPFALLRAAKAFPLYYPRGVRVAGKRYIDGEVGPTLADHIAFAAERGARRVLVLNDTQFLSPWQRWLRRCFVYCMPRALWARIWRDLATDSHVCPVVDGVEVVCVHTPQSKRFAEPRQRSVAETFNEGKEKAHEMHEQLRTLFT
jgi:predicted patatin/cPLA2 family phospholipase